MTYREIYTALIDDAIRLLGGPGPGESWQEAAERISAQIQSPEVPNIHNLVSQLETVAKEAGENSPDGRIANNLIKNLQVVRGMDRKHATYASESIEERIQEITEALQQFGDTVIGYHVLELLGSEAALRAKLQEATGREVDLEISQPPPDTLLQEKLTLNGKNRWVLTRLMPIIIARVKSQENS